jgi:hypothetical protein
MCYQRHMTASASPNPHATPLHDLDDFLALPRVAGLAVSPDGSRVVTTVTELDAGKTAYVTSVWELDANGRLPARRLTRGAKGESAPVFTAAGDLLFVAVREVPGSTAGEQPKASLWRLPATGGEAVSVLEVSGGVTTAHVAREADVTLVTAPLMPSANGFDDDARLRTLRTDNKVSAVLHTGYPVRHWDHDLGPEQPHLIDVAGLRDLSPEPQQALRDVDLDVSRDGTFVVTSWRVSAPGASVRSVLARIDVATGERTVIARQPPCRSVGPRHLARRHVRGVPAPNHVDSAASTTNHVVSHAFRIERVEDCHRMGSLAYLRGVGRGRSHAHRDRRRGRPRTGVRGRSGHGGGLAAHP